jgi:hypothetical protein
MPITGVEQPSSRQVTKQPNENRVIVLRYSYDRGYDYESEMPTVGAYDANYGYFRGYTSTLAPGYVIVELTYDSDGTVVNFSPGAGDTEYWATTTAEEVPIEYHPDYLTKWNYALWKKRTGGAFAWADFPGNEAAYNAATTLTDLRESEILRWSKDDPGTAWILVRQATKGTDFFLRPARTVFKRAYYRQQSSAESALVAVGTLVTPAETFGATGGNWLVTSSNTQYDGRYWVTETTYQHSNYKSATGLGWDTDIY